ncbi:24716_t:CDS:2, partial [Racocetra persica]
RIGSGLGIIEIDVWNCSKLGIVEIVAGYVQWPIELLLDMDGLDGRDLY